MGKGIILRVLKGTVISPDLSSTLKQLLPEYELEEYSEKPDYSSSINRRINSLYEAFLFNLRANPPDPKFTNITPETLKAYVDECKAACDLTKGTVEELHKELEKYTAKLVDAISVCWDWSTTSNNTVADAIACLNEAEQYVLMSRGRPDLATLTPITTTNGTEYILQYDQALPSYYDDLLKELDVIKTKNYPKTPAWFRRMPEYQQAYFCNLELRTVDPSTVMQELNSFIAIWDGIKKDANNISIDLNQIKSNVQPLPIWFNKLSKSLRSMVTVLASDPSKTDEKLKEIKRFMLESSTKTYFKNNISLIPQIPQWYWSLSKLQQSFLAYNLKNALTIEDAVAFPTSRHRTLPLPANFSVHSLYKINSKGMPELLYGKRYRSSHIASRDGLDFPEAVQQRHVDANLNMVMKYTKPDQYCLLQTLISPIYLADYVPSIVTDYLPELPPDLDLYKIARAAVKRNERSQYILQHNHPFNIAKLYYYTQSDDADSHLLLSTAQKFVSITPGLQELLTEYKNVLESPMGTATVWDYDGRELFLSSLEQLIIFTIGGYSYGSCVSGKDRKAVELMHTDAMIIYKLKYGIWPKFGDPKEKLDRLRFIDIVTDLYLSRHQHEHAGQNAPGSEGIKTPNWYWPKDIAELLNKRLGIEKGLIYDDRLASDNEVKNISKELKNYLLPAYDLLSKLTAKQLGEEICTSLYDALSSLINEERLFLSDVKGWTMGLFKENDIPKGILAIRKIMHDEQAGKDNRQRLEKIFSKVLGRPEANSNRTDATNSVYNCIRDLLQPMKEGLDMVPLALKAVSEWSKLFEASKRENCSLTAV